MNSAPSFLVNTPERRVHSNIHQDEYGYGLTPPSSQQQQLQSSTTRNPLPSFFFGASPPSSSLSSFASPAHLSQFGRPQSQVADWGVGGVSSPLAGGLVGGGVEQSRFGDARISSAVATATPDTPSRSTPHPPPRNSLFQQPTTASPFSTSHLQQQQQQAPSTPLTPQNIARLRQTSFQRLNESPSSSTTSTATTFSQQPLQQPLPTTAHHSVIVFGFPASSSSFVLKHFQSFGSISSFSQGEGNWITIEYEFAISASRALALNGMLIEPDLMIGVKLGGIDDAAATSTTTNPLSTNNTRERTMRTAYDIERRGIMRYPTQKTSFWARMWSFLRGS